MFDPKTNTITFPHVIVGDMLGSKKHTFNNVNNGFTAIADLNLTHNTFFGGNVDKLGMVKEYGFFLCPSRWNNQILGFYIHDPNLITEQGKFLIQQKFPDCQIDFQPVAEKKMTKEEFARWQELKREAAEKGVAADEITHLSADGLVAVIETLEKGVNPNAHYAETPPVVAPVSKKPTIITKVETPRGGKVPGFSV